MNARKPYLPLIVSGLGAFLALFSANFVQAGGTKLATEPFTSTTKVSALPNIMFALDDSGSMELEYLPDWAAPSNSDGTAVTPPHRYFNGLFNGVAYNPATRYRLPVMYTNKGELDTTTFPTQNGQSVSQGGNTSATATSPNWKQVKKDGYGIQSTATTDLTNQVFYYATVPGEYCKTSQLKTCATAKDDVYKYPATLRWCTTAAKALATTADANGYCQATNIADTVANAAAGVTTYTYPRMAGLSAAITVGSYTRSVSGITVGGKQILSEAVASTISGEDMALKIASKINACSNAATGNCTAAGFRATSYNDMVAISVPVGYSGTPAITSDNPVASVSAIFGGNVPGTTTLTTVTPAVNSYPKGANRTDCAGTTCTYNEEMANYANWYAYYQTRMQTMKSVASNAFSSVTDKYRVGYFSINNGGASADNPQKTAGDFLGVSAFDAAQKYAWYSLFLKAYPHGQTPLRTALANAGKMYANKLPGNKLNGVSVVDPMQYSCQQNYTILSTDGYWNDMNLPTQLDGTTPVGQQDGADNRPYYDGATFTKSVSQTSRKDDQVGINVSLVESRLNQLQKVVSQLSESVQTTTTYPYQLQTTPLQTRSALLTKSASNLVSTSYPLQQDTQNLKETTYTLNSTPRTLSSTLTSVTQQDTPVTKSVYNLTVGTSLLTSKLYNITVSTQLLNKQVWNVTRTPSTLTGVATNLTQTPSTLTGVATNLTQTPSTLKKEIFNVTKTVSLLVGQATNLTKTPSLLVGQATNLTKTTSLLVGQQTLLTKTTTALQSTTNYVKKTTNQLQMKREVSSNGGDTWASTGWVDVSSCTVGASVTGSVRNTQCQYNPVPLVTLGQTSCTPATGQSGTANGTVYSTPQNVVCAVDTTTPAGVANVASCTPVAGGTTASTVSCGYTGSTVASSGQSTCTPNNQATTGSMSGDQVVCAYDATAQVAQTAASSCTVVLATANPTVPKNSCTYVAQTAQTGLMACTPVAQGNTGVAGTYSSATVCAYDAAPQTALAAASSCSVVLATANPTVPKNSCTYQAQTAQTGLTACSTVAQGNTAVAGTVNSATACAYDASPQTALAAASSCSVVLATANPTVPKNSCTYQAQTAQTGQTTCTPVAQGNTAVAGAYSSATACAYDASATSTLTGQSSCTVVVATSSPMVPKTVCTYVAGSSTGNQTSCAYVAQGNTGVNGTVNSAMACAYDASAQAAKTGLSTCTVVLNAANPTVPKNSCTYVAGTPVTGQTSCTYAAQGSTSVAGTINSAMACAYDASAQAAKTGLSTCTVVLNAANPTVPKNSCTYVAGTPVTGQTSCTYAAKGSTSVAGTINSSMACAYDASAQAAKTGLSTCTVVLNTANPAVPKNSCAYVAGTPVTGQTTCAAVAQGNTGVAGTVNSSMACALDATPVSTATNQTTCTPIIPTPAASATTTTCTYQTATAVPGQTSCTAVAQGNVNGSTAIGTAVSCAYDATPTTTLTNLPSCTVVAPTPAASAPKTDCSYQTATTQAGQTSCTAVTQNSNTANGQVWPTGVTCAYDASATTTTPNQPSCTFVVPASPTSPKTTCAYGTANAATTVATCTKAAQASATTNGSVWNTSTTCNYAGAVSSGTGLASCVQGAASSGSTLNAYTTCSYVNGTKTSGLSSCSPIADSSGVGATWVPANTCAYDAAVVTNTNAASCTPVAKDMVGFSAKATDCAYSAAVRTTVSSCTNAAQSTSSDATWKGPAVACSYSTTGTPTTVTSCTPSSQSGPSFTGAKITCGYSGTPTVSNGVSSCTSIPNTADVNGRFSGPATTCTYGTFGAWSNVTSGSCTPAGQNGSVYTGPAVECAYNASATVSTLTDNSCQPVAGSTQAPYNVLTQKVCVPGLFVDPQVATAVNTVDTCSTVPTSVTNSTSGVNVATATTCTRLPGVLTDAATSCTPVDGGSGTQLVTSVTCPVRVGAWTGVAPTCAAVGSLPSAFDANGQVVECRTTDLTPYNASYTSGAVPVASCDVGTNPTTQVQTTCTPLSGTKGWRFVEDCTGTVGQSPDFIKTTCDTKTDVSEVPGCAEQAPSAENGWQRIMCTPTPDSGTYDTLADVAAYYYKTDLRTTALGNCTGTPVGTATEGNDVCQNNVVTTTNDPSNEQHMTSFTLGMGASGYMNYSNQYVSDDSGDFYTVKGGVGSFPPGNPQAPGITADPTNGVCSWQTGGACNWPRPNSDEQTTIDDLWHAGVNGHGAYFSATDPVSLGQSIAGALDTVTTAGGAAAAPTLSTPSLTPADSYIFSSTFVSYDWTGEVVRKQINPFTGIVSTTIDWSVLAKLNAKAPSTRLIYTFDSGNVLGNGLKEFNVANFGSNVNFGKDHIGTGTDGLSQFLCGTPDICLSDADKTSAAGSNLVNFLRGERTNEGAEKDNRYYYRKRQGVLGDIVNAKVVYVTNPNSSYADSGYLDWAGTKATRRAVVYAASNDGMLHAFAAKGSDSTEALITASASAAAQAYIDPTSKSLAEAAAAASAAAVAAMAADSVVGQELWAYVPSMVIPNLYKLADKSYRLKHSYFVDSTPVVGDVSTAANGESSASWRTILVGGLGHGGRGYYALDITDPDHPKSLWEFTDANLGYTYGTPEIVKLANGRWVVMFASGYNNIPVDGYTSGDGVGRLYVVDAGTGKQITSLSPISTGVGGADPSGLAKITAQVVNPSTDNTVEAVYGGDLLGNLWRFDVTDSIGISGYEAQLLATLKDGSENPQPVTTKPEVGLISGYKVVFVGTGQYLASDDAALKLTQTIYAIKDDRSLPVSGSSKTAIFDNPGGKGTSPRDGTSTEGFVSQVMTSEPCPKTAASSVCKQGDTVLTSTNRPVDFSPGKDNGWFVDLIHDGERANTNPALGLGLLAFNTNAPTLLACDAGGVSYGYFFNYLTGGPIFGAGNAGSSTDPNNSHGVVGSQLANKFASDPTIVVTNDGTLAILTGFSDGSQGTLQPPQPNLIAPTRRTSWRELIRGN